MKELTLYRMKQKDKKKRRAKQKYLKDVIKNLRKGKNRVATPTPK